MKLAVLIAAVALAAAVAPPRIELDLVQQGHVTKHDTDWTERCPASAETNRQNCPFPKATAYDHTGASINVKTSIFETNLEGMKGNQIKKSEVDFTQKAIYLFEYAATDAVGNEAEHIVFQLILDDVTPPKITCPAFSTSLCPDGYNADGCIEVKTSPVFRLPECQVSDNVTPAENIKVEYAMWGCRDDKVSRGAKGAYCKGQKQLIAHVKTRAQAQAYLKHGAKRLTSYIIGVSASDGAGVFGAGGVDNVAVHNYAIAVVDTIKPVVALNGPSKMTLECGTSYLQSINPVTGKHYYVDFDGNAVSNAVSFYKIKNKQLGKWKDPGVKVTDNYDCTNLRHIDDKQFHRQRCPMTAHATTNLDVHKVGKYEITYEASDSSGNVGTAERSITVVDDEPPQVRLLPLNGPWDIEYHQKTDQAFNDPGVMSVDNCDDYGHAKKIAGSADLKADSDAKEQTVTTYYVKKGDQFNLNNEGVPTTPTLTWDDLKIATYIKHYIVFDRSGNFATAQRTIIIEDKEQPIISLVGASTLTVEADHNTEFDDEGARCSDYVHGNLNRAVRSTGDIVKKDTPGKYYITYTCKDPSGNHAVPVTRTVVVADTTCPIVKVLGKKEITLEAGFPYVDQGAEASDKFDKTVSADDIVVRGNTVNYKHVFYTQASCADIKKSYKKAPTGEYTITRTDAKGELRQMVVTCDMINRRTYYKCEGCKKIRAEGSVYAGNDHGACAKRGLQIAKWGKHEKNALKFAQEEFPTFFVDGPTTTNYLCSVNDPKGLESNQAITVTTNKANEGKYVIKYFVKDAAGNGPACKNGICGCAAKRTVTVKDTLPPVISLRLKDKLIAVSGKSAKKGINGVANLAYKSIEQNKKGNPFLSMMAESTTTVNGWAVAAIASTVVGVALLSYSTKSVTTVPV